MDSSLSAKPDNLEQVKGNTRRSFLKKSLAVSATLATGSALLPSLSEAAEPLSQRYPDPLIHILDDSFLDLRIFNASVEKLATGMRWAEGPVWVGDGRYLLVSDIPNNRIMRWDEITETFTVYREHSNFSNGDVPGSPRASYRLRRLYHHKRRPPRHTHRIQRHDHRAGRQL